ncbi:Hypothetical protein A7982_08837 [Minicystis rosea]|nr:Hypothetical protein A7982_08837 [Minicystis rosea]
MSIADPKATEPAPRDAAEGPIALDGLVYGIDLLDALLVLHLGDAHLYASWLRPDAGLRADDIVTTLRDAYRVAQFAARRLNGGADRRGEAPAPVVTIELPQRIALLRRVRAHVIASIFDAAMPLGMARLVSSRLAAALEPELPLAPEGIDAPRPRPVVHMVSPAANGFDAAANALPRTVPEPVVRTADDAERMPSTLSFGSGLPRRSRPPPARPAEAERVGRLLAYLEAHAPEPHVVKYRLALRAGLTLSALENPDALGPEAMVLIETAVQDILGIDRSELRRIA